jgi:hypothetical protein
MSTRVESTRNFTTNITGIILDPWYSLECVKLYLKQEYFEKVSEFQRTVFDCGKYLNYINYMLFHQK